MEEAFRTVIEVLVIGIEAIGVGVIVLGSLAVPSQYLRRRHTANAYQTFRADLGRAILLGLEFLVAADIIRTVAVEPSFTNVGILAGIIAIRTLLSFSLELEINGRWPWQRAPEALARTSVNER